MNNNKTRIFVGLCFAYRALFKVTGFYEGISYFWHILCIVGWALVVLSLFTNKQKLAILGSALILCISISDCLSIFSLIQSWLESYELEYIFELYGYPIVATALSTLFWLLILFIALRKQNNSFNFLILLVTLLYFANAIYYAYSQYGEYLYYIFGLKDWIGMILMIPAGFMFGRSFTDNTIETFSASENDDLDEKQKERLSRLKALYKGGFISYDEYLEGRKKILKKY